VVHDHPRAVLLGDAHGLVGGMPVDHQQVVGILATAGQHLAQAQRFVLGGDHNGHVIPHRIHPYLVKKTIGRRTDRSIPSAANGVNESRLAETGNGVFLAFGFRCDFLRLLEALSRDDELLAARQAFRTPAAVLAVKCNNDCKLFRLFLIAFFLPI